MRKPRVLITLALVSLGLMCAAAKKAPDKAPFEDYADRIVTGDALTEEEMAEARKGFSTQLIRPDRLDFGQDARYRIAEIQLSHGKAREAVATLREVVAAQFKPDETIWVTRFNIAEILRVALNDADPAAAEFQQVEGNLQPLAQREMLDMLEKDPKRFDQAVATIQKAAAETKEKGARWALLTRLGNLYRRAQQDDKALAAFQQVAQEATPGQIERLRQEAAAQVEAAAKQIARLRNDDRDDEADDIEQNLQRQCNALRIQGRNDEADAMQAALDKLDAELKSRRPPAGASIPPATHEQSAAVLQDDWTAAFGPA
jgi:tetratricopeptide (TPR) repeat protein